MRTIILILFVALIDLQYKLWSGDGNIFQWRGLEKKLEAKTHENAALFSRNRAMEATILEFKRGDQALEEQARHELGMIKEGEVYYQFID